jgi:hypothetical protein
MSTATAEIMDGIQRGAVAAILHVAASNASAAREIACEFVAAAETIKAQSERIPLSSAVAVAFATGLSREQLLRLSGQGNTRTRFLDTVRRSATLVAQLGEAELERYRRVVIEAADRAAREVKESEFFSRRRKTRSEAEAIGEIRAALAGTTTVLRRPLPPLDSARRPVAVAPVPART